MKLYTSCSSFVFNQSSTFGPANSAPTIPVPSDNITVRAETTVYPGTRAEDLNLDYGAYSWNAGKVPGFLKWFPWKNCGNSSIDPCFTWRTAGLAIKQDLVEVCNRHADSLTSWGAFSRNKKHLFNTEPEPELYFVPFFIGSLRTTHWNFIMCFHNNTWQL